MIKNNKKTIVICSVTLVLICSFFVFLSLEGKKADKEFEKIEKIKDEELSKANYLQNDGTFIVQNGELQKKNFQKQGYSGEIQEFNFTIGCLDCYNYNQDISKEDVKYIFYEKERFRPSYPYLLDVRDLSPEELVYSYLIHVSTQEPDKFPSFLSEYFKAPEHTKETLFKASESVGLKNSTIYDFEDKLERLRILSAYFIKEREHDERMNTSNRF